MHEFKFIHIYTPSLMPEMYILSGRMQVGKEANAESEVQKNGDGKFREGDEN